MSRPAPASSARSRRAAPPAPHARPFAPPWPLLALLAVWALVLLAAPPQAVPAWAVNGFRSIGIGARVGLLAAAALASVLAARMRGGAAWALVAGALALALAFPLRERAHVLGDTDVRQRTIADLAAGVSHEPPIEWSRRLHASPLDLLVDVLVPVALVRAGLPVEDAASCVALLLAALAFAGIWRATARAPVRDRFALALALALAGSLEAFAGYAESAPLLLVAVVWWWTELERPLQGRAQVVRTTLAWLALALAHRMGLVLLVPQLLRALSPALPGDTLAARRALFAGSLLAAAAVVFVPVLNWGAGQAGIDVAPLLAALRQLPRLSIADVAGGFVLVAPLVLVALACGRDALAAAARDPRTAWALAGAAPLAVLVLAGWVAPNGLGAHRDWDLATAPGLLLSLAAATALAALPHARLRAALACAAPVLALQAGAWVAVNADAQAATARTAALAADARALGPDQRGTLLMMLAQRAADRGDRATAAAEQRQAFELAPDVPRGLLAAEFLLMARDRDGARAVLARVHGLPPPDSATASILRGLDSLITVPTSAGAP